MCVITIQKSQYFYGLKDNFQLDGKFTYSKVAG
jgi:hypothetical protein